MSNSLLVDLDNTPGDLAALKKDLNDEVQSVNQRKADRKETPPEDDIPEKYRGKSVHDVIKMHQNAESELGRRGNELGQYKSLTDQLLSLKRADDLRKGGAEEEEIEDIKLPKVSSTDLLDNPADVIGNLVKEALNQERQRTRKQADKKAEEDLSSEFASKHPDAVEVANSPEFIEWVNKSPSRALAGYNAAQGDLRAGDALLTEWKELRKETPTEDPKPQSDPLKEARKASTESAGANNTPDKPTGKIYRRLDLIRLKLEDPEAYADPEFQRQIMLAYAQGRVK